MSLDHLQEQLETLNTWYENRDFLDHEKLEEVQSVKRVLQKIEGRLSSALPWALGKILVSFLINEYVIDNDTIQETLSTLVSKVDILICNSTNPSVISKIFLTLWKSIFGQTEHVAEFLEAGRNNTLYATFLEKCFQNMKRKEAVEFLFQLIEASYVPNIIGKLIVHPNQQTKSILHRILDLLFVQLVEPYCPRSKSLAQNILLSCGWQTSSPIRDMLNDSLMSPDEEECDLVSVEKKYDTILQLLFVSKDLVVGLINNMELCFNPGRLDRLIGMEFFCKLFGAQNIPGLANPSKFYSHLWHAFLSQNVSLYEHKELKILAQYTSKILSQTSVHQEWCAFLLYVFEYDLPTDIQKHFIISITDFMQDVTLLSEYSDPPSLMCLVEKLLTPTSPYELFGEVRNFLLTSLGKIYMNAAMTGVNDMTLHRIHKLCSKLLSCFLGTCGSFSPTNESWATLRKIFVNSLVSYKVGDEMRMKMLLYLWINVDTKWLSVLHELFCKTKWARIKVFHILDTLKTEDPAENHKHHLSKLLKELSLVLVEEGIEGNFMQTFLLQLTGNKTFRSLLLSYFPVTSTCSSNCQTSGLLLKLFSESDQVYSRNTERIVKGLLYYLAEITCDLKSIKHLLKLVNSCVMESEISKFCGMDHLDTARIALHLLNEILFLLPHMGLNEDVQKCLFEWSRSKYGNVSALALRCMTSIIPCKKLGIICPHFEEENLYLWMNIIWNGSKDQVKMAIRCIASCNSTIRDLVLGNCLVIITSLLKDSDNSKDFQQGVSALDNFSTICPPALKGSVENTCEQILMPIVETITVEEESGSMSSLNISLDWQKLRHISVLVRVIHSVGRCMRYCGTTNSVQGVVKSLKQVLSLQRNCTFHNYKEVDIDHLQCEAALALLSIFETSEFQSLITRELLVALSAVMVHPGREVHHRFAEKLCQGLSPHKVRHLPGDGQTKGMLPPCFLGLLALMGSDVWQNYPESKEKADLMLKQVCVSRHLAVLESSYFASVTLDEFYAKEPILVLENILAGAVPILVENLLANVSDFEEAADGFEKLKSVTRCLKFVFSVIRRKSGCVVQSYVEKMPGNAKQMLNPLIYDDNQKKYDFVFQVLLEVVKHYKPKSQHCVSPPVLLLPPPFFSAECRNLTQGGENALPLPLLNKLLRGLYYPARKSGEENQLDDSTIEADGLMNSSVASLGSDFDSSRMSRRAISQSHCSDDFDVSMEMFEVDDIPGTSMECSPNYF